MKRGWCPTVHEPMPTGDGLLLRVKPPQGRLSSAEVRLIAAVAARHGNGIVELTQRGNLQLRGVQPDATAAAASALVGAGLADADPRAERRRNVVVSPLAQHDPDIAPGTIALAAQVETMLAGVADVSPKFSIAIDGGGVLPLAGPADIVVGDGGRRLVVDTVAATVASETVIATLRQIVIACAGDRVRTGLGPALLHAAGLEPRLHTPAPAISPIGFHPYRNGLRGGYGLGVPFGQTDAPTLHALADFADRFAHGSLCLTPDRAVLLGVVDAADIPLVAEGARRAGFIVDQRDPRLRIYACIGNQGCASGSVDARGDAARFARTPFEGTLHVSGCAKGCAHPKPATLTLVGDNGGYQAVRAA